MLTSIRIDRIYDKKIKWQDNLKDPDSEDYQELSYEASQAVSHGDFPEIPKSAFFNGKKPKFFSVFPDRIRHVDDTV